MSLAIIQNSKLEIGPRKSVRWIIFASIHLIIVSLCLFRFATLKFTSPVPGYIILLFAFAFIVMFGTSIHCLLTNFFQKTKLEVTGDILKIETSLSMQETLNIKLSEVSSINSEFQSGFLNYLYRTQSKLRLVVTANGKSYLISSDLKRSEADELITFIVGFQHSSP